MKLSNDLNDIHNKVKKIKSELDITATQTVEKLWRSPFGSPNFQIVVTLTLILSLLKLTVINEHWLPTEEKSENGRYYDIIDISIYFFWLVMPPILVFR